MSEIKQFYITQDGEKAVYTAVIISHPAIGDFRLIKDYIGNKSFVVDGSTQEFMGAMVSVPEEAILSDDDIDKGTLSFSRIGYEVLNEVRKIDSYGKLEATTVRILKYLEGSSSPQSDYTAYVETFDFGVRDVSFSLTTRNLSKSTKNNEIFDPRYFPGLENT